jgi:hypothetical protein
MSLGHDAGAEHPHDVLVPWGRPARGWWDMACWNALSADQQRRLIEVGNLPFGYSPEGGACHRGAQVCIECEGDEAHGPRFYCLPCAVEYLRAKSGA